MKTLSGRSPFAHRKKKARLNSMSRHSEAYEGHRYAEGSKDPLETGKSHASLNLRRRFHNSVAGIVHTDSPDRISQAKTLSQSNDRNTKMEGKARDSERKGKEKKKLRTLYMRSNGFRTRQGRQHNSQRLKLGHVQLQRRACLHLSAVHAL